MVTIKRLQNSTSVYINTPQEQLSVRSLLPLFSHSKQWYSHDYIYLHIQSKATRGISIYMYNYTNVTITFTIVVMTIVLGGSILPNNNQCHGYNYYYQYFNLDFKNHWPYLCFKSQQYTQKKNLKIKSWDSKIITRHKVNQNTFETTNIKISRATLIPQDSKQLIYR